ncbi:MAG: phosphatidylglycerophosphatase A [Candidatus Omnitrophica bacterium]|nr:phosphatidylglycerophosphatase A [Candidatus Omnitrophota bacterium]
MIHRISRVIATACGVGYAPQAPGTVASLLALLLWYWLQPSVWIQGIAAVFVMLIGGWAAGDCAKQQHDPDPSCVVVDEVAGMWLALIGLPRHLVIVLIAFILFRALDIIKIPPIRQLERLPGGLGIMLDDVAAGLCARSLVAVLMPVILSSPAIR